MSALDRRLTRVTALIAVALGITVLVGWLAHLPVLTQLLPDHPPGKANTAVMVTLAGLSMLGFRRSARLGSELHDDGGESVLLKRHGVCGD